MSYLEMYAAPVPDMQKGIISLWFREVSRQQAEPTAAKVWPQDFWKDANADTVMVPPNAQYSLGYDKAFEACVFFFNSYGLPPGGLGGEIFGDAFLGPAAVWIPNSPPLPLNTMSSVGSAIGGVADVDMSQYGIRTLLTFGDADLDYQYCSWSSEFPPVIPAVQYLPNIGLVDTIVSEQVPPYFPYLKVVGGKPIGKDGLLTVANYRLNSPSAHGKVPPSFIGIDRDGHIVINLQTSTKADVKGMAFEMEEIKEIWAMATYLHVIGPPYSYGEIGFPFPDGVWKTNGPFWAGYEFGYRDASEDVMQAAPESFLIYGGSTGFQFANGPTIEDGGWHHLLFSFDISGSVSVIQPSPTTNPDGTQSARPSPEVSSSCEAWLAVDDKNYTGVDLQNRPPVHDGFLLPKLRGTQTTQILDCGPCTTMSRNVAGLGVNEILPRNAWLIGYSGNPKDNLPWFTGVSAITNGGDLRNSTARLWGGKVGDFNWIDWTGAIWPLYGHGVAPGPWQATYNPPSPTTSDTSKFDVPTYTCSGFSIPMSGSSIGVPVNGTYSDYNSGVEMAELQIWANQSVDTSDVNVRRLFVDSNGKPVSPSVAANALGKPDVLLHGSSNWKNGNNTGTSGIRQIDDGTGAGTTVPGKNPAGQFQPTAKINSFTPEPQLGK